MCWKNDVKIKKIDTNVYYVILYYIICYTVLYVIFNKEKEKRDTRNSNLKKFEFLNDLLLDIPIE